MLIFYSLFTRLFKPADLIYFTAVTVVRLKNNTTLPELRNIRQKEKKKKEIIFVAV